MHEGNKRHDLGKKGKISLCHWCLSLYFSCIFFYLKGNQKCKRTPFTRKILHLKQSLKNHRKNFCFWKVQQTKPSLYKFYELQETFYYYIIIILIQYYYYTYHEKKENSMVLAENPLLFCTVLSLVNTLIQLFC